MADSEYTPLNLTSEITRNGFGQDNLLVAKARSTGFKLVFMQREQFAKDREWKEKFSILFDREKAINFLSQPTHLTGFGVYIEEGKVLKADGVEAKDGQSGATLEVSNGGPRWYKVQILDKNGDSLYKIFLQHEEISNILRSLAHYFSS